MDTSELSSPDFKNRKQAQSAFSLVEVTLAIGIIAFGFISVFGLIPTGLNAFHQTMIRSAEMQIAQRVLNDVQQTDFSTLIQNGATTTFRYTWTLPNNTTSQVRYFDDQGSEVTDPTKAIYHVNTRITTATVFPYTGPRQPAQSNNANLATATIQLACNPGNLPLALSATTNLWTGAYQSMPSNTGIVHIVSFSAMVSRNSQ